MPRRLVVLIALAAVIALGCYAPGNPPSGDALPSTLAATGWRVVRVNGRAPIPGREPTLAFEVERVGGSGGCNHIGARYRYDPRNGALEITDAGGTAMACVEAGVTEFEGLFMTALAGSTKAALDGSGRLVLFGPGSEILLAPDSGARQ
jgi:heat shock protein HslJ